MSEPEAPLSEELRTYERHREELLSTAPGRWVLIHGDEIVDTFDERTVAIDYGYRVYGTSGFLVRRISATERPANFLVRFTKV